MIETVDIKLKNGIVQAVKIPLQKVSLILIRSNNGYIMCGYLNMDIANKLGDIAAKVTGVQTIDEALDATIVELSENAKFYDVEIGMNARRFLNTIMKGK